MSTERTLVRVREGRATLAGSTLVPRLTAPGEVALVASRALLLGGDHLELQIEVGEGERLLVRDVAAMVAYDGGRSAASYDVSISVGRGATLIWDALPLVLSDGADVRRSLTAECAEGARMIVRDTLRFGRTAQRGGRLSCTTRIDHVGRPVVAEDLRFPDAGAGMFGDGRVLDTATAIGIRPASDGGTRFELDGEGVVVRDLTDDAHASAVGPVWERWCAEVSGR
ncbi:hypothetical protein GCM10028801_16930 [Nocardioides maradonensis]